MYTKPDGCPSFRGDGENQQSPWSVVLVSVSVPRDVAETNNPNSQCCMTAKIISHLPLKSTASWPQLCALRVSGTEAVSLWDLPVSPGERKEQWENHDGSLCSTWKRHMVLPLRFLGQNKSVAKPAISGWKHGPNRRGCRRDIRLSEQTTPNATEPLTELVLL